MNLPHWQSCLLFFLFQILKWSANIPNQLALTVRILHSSNVTLTTKAADVMFILIDDHISIPASSESTLSESQLQFTALMNASRFLSWKLKKSMMRLMTVCMCYKHNNKQTKRLVFPTKGWEEVLRFVPFLRFSCWCQQSVLLWKLTTCL